MKMESCVKQDQRGFYFYSQSKVALDMLELGTDEIIRLITEAKLSGSYFYIILDLDFGIDKDVMRLPYSTVLFDLDVTLFDFRAAEAAAIRQVLKNNNLPSEEEAVKTYSDINLRYWHLFESGEISREQIFTGSFVTLLNTFGINGDAKKLSSEYGALLSMQHQLVDGAEDILHYCKEKGYRIYVASNGLSSTQYRRIGESGVSEYFEKVFVSEDSGYKKPEREFFDYIVENGDEKDRSRMLLVGDSQSSDILGGINAGIDTCWFNPSGKQFYTLLADL